MDPSIALLTCTGGRPEAFALAERWVAHQTRQPDQWIVVDDVEEPTELTMGQFLVRPKRLWEPGGPCTLAHNMLLGLEAITSDIVVVWEDDDYYGPDWLATVAGWLSSPESCLVGEGQTYYYHVGSRRYHRHGNLTHASLCATAFKHRMIHPVCDIIIRNGPSPFIDHQLWRRLDGQIYDTHNVIGIKGRSGRPGAGRGHCDDGHWSNWDFTGAHLRQLIGADAEAYLPFYNGLEPTPEIIELARRLGPNSAMAANEKAALMETLDERLRTFLEGLGHV